MRVLTTSLLLMVCASAHAKPKMTDEERAARVPVHRGALWPPQLPLDPGPLPEGLASASAQGCAACHAEVASAWSSSAHAGPLPEALVTAARSAEEPACTGCHQPLVAQHPHPLQRSSTGLSMDTSLVSPTWSASLSAEGVTCTACHQRDGRLLGVSPRGAAPHAQARRDDLGSPAACATCHQLTWPGAAQPLYDTYGEWSRSSWADAGVTCVDCHMGPGAGAVAAGADHAMPAEVARAVTALVRLDGPVLARGGDGLSGSLILQNTGAGHAVPTGSPFTGLRLAVHLRAPDAAAAPVEVMRANLQRSVTDGQPWTTTRDTRLPAGESRSWPLALGLPVDAAPGRWMLTVSLTSTRDGEPSEAPVEVRSVPIEVR